MIRYLEASGLFPLGEDPRKIDSTHGRSNNFGGGGRCYEMERKKR